ncbi:MAG: flagellar hook-basal body complex protein FliE [Nitrospirales bacterium]|nr:flagellar hook-basal body complex protein FliE [Nitrospirales bacterium]
MTDLKITGSAIGQSNLQVKSDQKAEGGAFGDALKDAIGKVAEMQNEAEKGIRDLTAGGDVTQAVIAMEKADMSFQVMVEVRNRLQSAYEEIMRMQI